MTTATVVPAPPCPVCGEGMQYLPHNNLFCLACYAKEHDMTEYEAWLAVQRGGGYVC